MQLYCYYTVEDSHHSEFAYRFGADNGGVTERETNVHATCMLHCLPDCDPRAIHVTAWVCVARRSFHSLKILDVMQIFSKLA